MGISQKYASQDRSQNMNPHSTGTYEGAKRPSSVSTIGRCNAKWMSHCTQDLLQTSMESLSSHIFMSLVRRNNIDLPCTSFFLSIPIFKENSPVTGHIILRCSSKKFSFRTFKIIIFFGDFFLN